MLVKAIAKKVDPFKVLVLAPVMSDFKSKWVGGTERLLSSLFDYCKQWLASPQPPSKIIIFFDEFEGLGGKRGEASEHTAQTVGHMLQLIDGVYPE